MMRMSVFFNAVRLATFAGRVNIYFYCILLCEFKTRHVQLETDVYGHCTPVCRFVGLEGKPLAKRIQ